MSEQFKIDAKIYSLGTTIVCFYLPINLIDSINKAYDENSKELKPHNDYLAGKILEEKRINKILTPLMNNIFKWCFEEYLEVIGKPNWNIDLSTAWINEMKSGEYNPAHFHTGKNSELGLSSVLMLKRPSTYGKEVSNPDNPSNGWLEFSGGDQAPLSQSQILVDAEVGEFYVFPYTLLHGVYPFNSTDQVRRTLSFNCDIIKKSK